MGSVKRAILRCCRKRPLREKKNVVSTIGNATDVYSRHRLTLDLGTSYAIRHEVRIYFDAKNLLNTPLEFTEGTSDSRPIQREFYDITLLAGVRLSF